MSEDRRARDIPSCLFNMCDPVDHLTVQKTSQGVSLLQILTEFLPRLQRGDKGARAIVIVTRSITPIRVEVVLSDDTYSAHAQYDSLSASVKGAGSFHLNRSFNEKK